MRLTGKVINRCYIVQKKVNENPFGEIWTVKSIYSPDTFLLHRPQKPADRTEELSLSTSNSLSGLNDYWKKQFLLFSKRNNHFFMKDHFSKINRYIYLQSTGLMAWREILPDLQNSLFPTKVLVLLHSMTW